jgi:hypothetical protein
MFLRNVSFFSGSGRDFKLKINCFATMRTFPRNETHDGDILHAWFILICKQGFCYIYIIHN